VTVVAQPTLSDAELAYLAVMNILEDAADEKRHVDETHRAMLNILDDTLEERAHVEDGQRAVVNILEDAADEKHHIDETHRAMLNILDDTLEERAHVDDAQKALLNILEDLDTEKETVESANHDLKASIEEHRRSEAALREATGELQRSNDDLEMFAYAASHDLSEPLRAISVPIALLARQYEGQLDDKAHELITFAVDGCQRMQALIEDLLTYSRIGRFEDAPTPQDASRIAQEVLITLGPAIAEAGARVVVGELPSAVVDPMQLAQLLQNLISNAIKFARPGEVVVNVDAEPSGAFVRFTVTDNGIGIAPEYRERVFGLFKRLHGRDEYRGTGIGLAVAKKVVERHGGEIGIADPPGGTGTQFWFTLPAAP
jgi:light-regulated signal transduction histidine kinase (bacteriophytochrome)